MGSTSEFTEFLMNFFKLFFLTKKNSMLGNKKIEFTLDYFFDLEFCFFEFSFAWNIISFAECYDGIKAYKNKENQGYGRNPVS